MPIAFILVAMLTLSTGWYATSLRTDQAETKRVSEAQSVASNMMAYQKLINAYARYTNELGEPVNAARFNAFNGDARDFIAQSDAAGGSPGIMTWFKGPMPGVSAVIENGTVFLYYNPTSTAHATQRGVQSELVRLTQGSYGVGKAVNTTP